MLVVGDSLVWGQGLAEKDKFYTLTKNWIEKESGKMVNLKVKAHSGATLFLHDDQANLLKKSGMSENTPFYPEVNTPFPTLISQIDTARSEYERAEDVDIVLLTGGLVDLSVAGILEIRWVLKLN